MAAQSTTRFDELKATNQLPSPTGVALALLRLAESESSTTAEIARVLQSDPALSGRVLKLANSAYSGRTRPVTSVRDAVTQLGIRLTRNIALSFSLVSQHGRGACSAFDYPRFWSHSLATAVAAQAGAHRTGQVPPHEAFTCGLLAQVGRLALATVYPDAYSAILARVGPDDAEALSALERAQFAADHNELTAALLRDWGLPEMCALAAEHYERPDPLPLPPGDRALTLVRLLQMAARMAAVCLADGRDQPARMLDLLAAGARVGIDPPDLIALCDRVAAEWRDWGQILQVHTCAVPPFAELAERASAARDVASEDQFGTETPALGRLNIVVVDDDMAALQALTAQLRKAGHTVHSACSGGDALRLVLETHPQLVITDGQMPGMDGAMLVKALRQTKMGRQLYILMLTGSEADEAVEAYEAGADDYAVKPCNLRLLAARLRACARVVHLQEEVRREKEELRRCMAELGVANRKLQQAAMTDALTGLCNRRYALERLEQEWADAQRTGGSLACLVIDIDHFKRVNDTHGHDIGDLALRVTAERLRSRLRPSDVVCRLGGEEFVVIGAGMACATALACAERLRAHIEAHSLDVRGGSLRLTLSIGVAVRTADMQGFAELLKAADEAVYRAKERGRNQVCLARS